MVVVAIILILLIFGFCFIGVLWTLGKEMEEYKKEHAEYIKERLRAIEIRKKEMQTPNYNYFLKKD